MIQTAFVLFIATYTFHFHSNLSTFNLSSSLMRKLLLLRFVF